MLLATFAPSQTSANMAADIRHGRQRRSRDGLTVGGRSYQLRACLADPIRQRRRQSAVRISQSKSFRWHERRPPVGLLPTGKGESARVLATSHRAPKCCARQRVKAFAARHTATQQRPRRTRKWQTIHAPVRRGRIPACWPSSAIDCGSPSRSERLGETRAF